MNQSKKMVDTTGRTPTNPKIQNIPVKSQSSAGSLERSVEDAKVEASEPSDNVDLFDSPSSSNISGALYYREEQELRITFRGHGEKPMRKYKYEKFPEESWADFKEAPSKGEYFAAFIRPHFKGIPID